MSDNKKKSATKAEKAVRVTKIDTVLSMLRRPQGADVTALSEATGWQIHSVRGAIAGHIKKKLGLTVTTEKVGGKTVYRIQGAEIG
jgi:hypothetical protein